MSQHTPDSWIERNEDDPHDPYFRGGDESGNPCDNGTCDHFTHCDGCLRGMPAHSVTGFCFVCDSEWMAARQLPFRCDEFLGIKSVLADFTRRFTVTR